MKIIKRLVTLVLLFGFAVTIASCDKKANSSESGTKDLSGEGSSSVKNQDKEYNPETTPLVLATQTPDGVFSPFFGNSAYDMEITSMTQLSMLSSDEDGKVSVGLDKATVAEDYTEVTTDVRDDKSKDDYANYYTTYEFLIKNDLKFSDGTPLTIDDVLFNLYVYLDPAYSGSTTIYSTNIQGLKAYRLQDPNATDSDIQNQEAFFAQSADQRRDALISYLTEDSSSYTEGSTQVQNDLDALHSLFNEELETDWTNAQNSISSYSETYQFTEGWQIFLFNYGYIGLDSEYLSKIKKENDAIKAENLEHEGEEGYPKELKAKQVPEAISWNGYDTKSSSEVTKEKLLTMVEDSMFNAVTEKITRKNILSVLYYYQSGQALYDKFVAEAKSDYLSSLGDSGNGRVVKNVSGITVDTVSGTFNGKEIDGEHDVLRIKINGVDPKAIWNFGFGVAPLAYYSPELAKTVDRETNFGVEFGDINWFNQLQSNVVPLGAGPYVVTTETEKTPTRSSDFFDSNIVYMKRNDNFLLGAPKIRLLRYKVIASDKLLAAVTTGEVDYADPNAKTANYNSALADPNVQALLVDNNGYGYIGFNASKVKDIEIRKIMMETMNTKLIKDCYQGDMAKPIYRSMPSTSWAYPSGAKPYYPYLGIDEIKDSYSTSEIEAEKTKIINLIEDLGYTKNGSGVYHTEIDGRDFALKFTFTLAGESQDHPAYKIFKQSSDILNDCGFDITVQNDPNALSKLATGGLSVWAAAWGSTIDPDMYQVYHKDSTATSILNWGIPYIEKSGTYFEKQMLDELALNIEEGRKYTDVEDRKPIYEAALEDVMELAIELPTYQRKNLFVYNSNKIDGRSLVQNVNPYQGPLSEIWNVTFN